MKCRIKSLQLLGAFLLLLSVLQGAEWSVGTVPGSVGGRYSSIKFDKLGNAHVAYCDGGHLRYSFWDHSLDKWFSSTVGGCGGFISLVLDSKQNPHISLPAGFGAALVHIYWDGTKWNTQTAEIHATVINYFTSLTLDSQDNPSIIFYEEVAAADMGIGRRLREVSWNGKFWVLQTVDSEPGCGKFNAIETDSKGYQHIAYANVLYESASLRYAEWNGKSWDLDILEGKGVPGTAMYSVGMVLGADDNPHIVYTDMKNKIVKYAERKNGKWNLEQVDALGDAGYPDRNGIALDEQGNPYVSYYDSGQGLLKVAHKTKGKWVTEVVDHGFAGFTNSLAISNGVVWVTYSDTGSQDLKVAKRPLKQDPAKTSEVR